MTNSSASSEKNSRREEAVSHHSLLLGKVVLLIGNDTAVVQTLAGQLAQKGADVALVCRQFSRETLRLIRESVESVGRRFLLIEDSERRPVPPDSVVQTVTSVLGSLDIFIDLSAQTTEALFPRRGNGTLLQRLRPNWHLRHIVFEEIIRSNNR